MIETLANLADGMAWAYDKLDEYGAPRTPEAVAVLFAAYAAADSFDPDAGAIRGNAGKALKVYVAACETLARTATIADQTEPTPDAGTPIDLAPTGAWDDRAFHAAVTASEIWQSRNHEVTSRRSNSGRTMVKVVRRGVASVTGDVTGCGFALDAYGVRRTRLGLDAIGVARVTARLFPEVDPMLGTDAMAWSEVIPGDASATDVYGVARHTADAAGYLSLTSADRSILSGPERAHAGKLSWPARTTLRKPARRASDPVETSAALIGAHTDPDRLWHGHRLVTRQPAKHARTARTTRTVGAFRADSLASALDAMRGAQLDAGQRATFTAGDWSLTVTRGKGARKAWSARAKRDGAEAVAVKGSVSGAACADRLARLTADA